MIDTISDKIDKIKAEIDQLEAEKKISMIRCVEAKALLERAKDKLREDNK